MNYGIQEGDQYRLNEKYNRFEKSKPIKPFKPLKPVIE